MELSSHESLDGINSVVGVGDHLVLCGFAHNTLCVTLVTYDGRSSPVAFRVCDDLGFISFHYCNAAVGRTQIDTNNFSHFI